MKTQSASPHHAGDRPPRREFLKTVTSGAAAAALIGFPRVSRAQTKLSLGLWDHWVPGANDALKKVVEEWGRAN